MHPCERCGAPIQDKYRLCYQCASDARMEEEEARRARGSPYNARTGYTATYVATQPENAVERKETPYTTRQEEISRAHDENIKTQLALIEAIEHLTGVLRLFTILVENLNKPLDQHPVEKGKGSQ